MRLFVGVWPAKNVLDAVRKIGRPNIESLRWIPERNWHLTLAFLGDVEDQRIESLVQGLATVRHAPFESHLDGKTTVLARNALSLQVNGADKLAEKVSNAADIERSKPFQGHMTIARSRNTKLLHIVAVQIEPTSWPITECSLIRSDISDQGATYTEIAKFPLTKV